MFLERYQTVYPAFQGGKVVAAHSPQAPGGPPGL